MIEEAIKDLAKRVFGFIAVALVLSVPMMLYVGPSMESEASLNGMTATDSGLLMMGALVVFSLVILGVLFFHVLPGLTGLVKAIRETRREGDGEIFP